MLVQLVSSTTSYPTTVSTLTSTVKSILGNTKKVKAAICQQMRLELLNEAFSAKATR
jgi:hypothetical protein